MGRRRNLVLGRCAAVLFLCGAVASLPTNAILGATREAYLVDALALVSAVICLLIPWHRIDRRWLHVLVAIATAEVVLAVVVHSDHAVVFMWYFVLVAVFAAYAFRRRGEVAAQFGICVAGMISSALYASSEQPDAVANAIVGIPTVVVAGGVVVWLRENLERRERTDPLTGLGNRRALMEALEDAAADRAVRLFVLFDLDGFKRYNDRLGHAAGDDLLVRLGGQLNEAAKGSGEAFRLGGDELCVLLEDSGALPACEAALRGDGIGASHGSAWLPREADTASAALTLADSRMYAAKRAATDVPFVVVMESASPSRPSDPAPTRAR
jgi:GGDEF domain-containing protein